MYVKIINLHFSAYWEFLTILEDRCLSSKAKMAPFPEASGHPREPGLQGADAQVLEALRVSLGWSRRGL